MPQYLANFKFMFYQNLLKSNQDFNILSISVTDSIVLPNATGAHNISCRKFCGKNIFLFEKLCLIWTGQLTFNYPFIKMMK